LRIRALVAILPFALTALPQTLPAGGNDTVVSIGDSATVDIFNNDSHDVNNVDDVSSSHENEGMAGQARNDGGIDGNMTVDDVDAVVLDAPEFEITVRHRAATPLSPSSRVIKASEFRGKFADLPSALESVSGVDIRSMGGYGQYAESSIRGGTALGARVYLDGVPLNSASTGAVDLSKIPLDRITEIRIAKGTSGLRRMGAGMGGVIELFTTDEDANNSITGINIEAGSFGLIKGGAIVKRSGGKTIRRRGDTSTPSAAKEYRFCHQINADVSKSDNDYSFIHDNGTTLSTLRDPDPARDDTVMRKSNNYYRSIDAAYSLSADISESHKITQRINVGAYRQGLFTYHYKENQSGTTSGNTVICGVDYRGELSKRWALGAEASGIYRSNSLSDPDARFGLGGAKNIESDGATADFLLDARYSFTENFYMAGLAGARYDGYAQRSKERNEKPEMSRREYRAGAEAVIKANIGESSTAETALRAVYKYEIDTSGTGFDNWATDGKKYQLNYPVAEAVFRIDANPVTFQFGAAASKRSPTFFERFGWSSGFISNPDLREETRAEADAGISIDMGEYGAAASVFGGTVGDKIKSIPYSNSFVKVMNFADTKFYGAELDIHSKLLRVVNVELSAAYLTSVIIGAEDPTWFGRTEPFTPELSGFLKTEITLWKLNIGHGIKYESACYLNIENIVKRPQQFEFSAWASCKINKSLSMRYRVDNYLNTAVFDFLDNPKPRRMHSVGVELGI
jgi:outer membrane cobalamin receptor